MKPKALIISTVVFFLLVNTMYYWEPWLGVFTFPAYLLLLLVFLGLVVLFLRQIYLLIKEKFSNKKRLWLSVLMILVLTSVILKPDGLIDFEKFEGTDLLVAEREGAANCMIKLKLRDNGSFKLKSYCFGAKEVSGTYHLQKDTIFFDHLNPGRSGEEYYQFAIIHPSGFSNSKIIADLVMYKGHSDTAGYVLWITKMDML